ncbi:caib baif family enzyme [Colletotrichum asianum]|uniref:Caib baif family enzyme n=1 Tax=Colletotrichum asianum TaxID=702518 RepID=A0A8H3WUF3_9PEZI|nr:caib baif family enzyme [Colletotrichum asianum]
MPATINGSDGHQLIDEFTILTPNAMLGYGYDSDHFWYGIEKYKPAAIIVDSGSTDGGPYKLGMGKMACGRGSYVRDLEPILEACFHHKIKVLIGSAGGDGSNKHVAEMLDLVTEIAERKGYSFKVATIQAGMDREWIKSRISQNRVGPCGPVEPLLPEVVDGAVDVVAQMGSEPYLEALKENPDIIIGGRSYDPAPFADHGVRRNLRCPERAVDDRNDEKGLLRPYSAVSGGEMHSSLGPGGVLNLDGAKYEQITPKTCRVSGAKFETTPYQVKLEGVSHLGYRTIFIGGIRDAILIGQIDNFLERVRVYSQKLFPELDKSEKCQLLYHVYGKDGVMGPLEPVQARPHEIAVLGEVVAPTSELSHTIANNVRASILHFAYPDQDATTGNFASPLSPHEQDAGAVFKFSLYHLVDLDDGEEASIFPIRTQTIGSSQASPEPVTHLSSDVFSKIDNGELAPLTSKSVPQEEAPLSQVARIIRSKNSGPFEMTFDVMFDDESVYRRVREANVFTNETIKKLYRVTDDDILTNMYFDPALAWKCTIKRPWAQGSVGERDTLGTQQHAPLLGIRIPAAKTSAQPKTNGVVTAARKVIPREDFSAQNVVQEIWKGLELPAEALSALNLENDGAPTLPSSFKMGVLAQSSIASSALAAAQIHALRNESSVPAVDVPLEHATVEFKSERLYILDGKPTPSPWGPLEVCTRHLTGMFDSTREQLSEKLSEWASIDVETAATVDGKLATYALRSYRQWDALPQSRAISNFPIDVTQLSPQGPTGLPARMSGGNTKCLQGLRVVEMSRVIAAPLCGKTLAAHGADVIWVTSPNLPDLPTMDRDFGRGKRTVQLDVHNPSDKERLIELIKTADVFIQGFRPGSLASHGLSPEEIVKINPSIIIANMSAFGPQGPWSGRRGYDSLVQTCSGMNVSEAEHAGKGEAARPTPCQALDHAGGYWLATGVIAALHKRATLGGSWRVDASLAGVMKYLRSLGQYPGATGFEVKDYEKLEDVRNELFETRETGFGSMTAIRHSAHVDGVEVGWDVMPKPLGSDSPKWIH